MCDRGFSSILVFVSASWRRYIHILTPLVEINASLCRWVTGRALQDVNVGRFVIVGWQRRSWNEVESQWRQVRWKVQIDLMERDTSYRWVSYSHRNASDDEISRRPHGQLRKTPNIESTQQPTCQWSSIFVASALPPPSSVLSVRHPHLSNCNCISTEWFAVSWHTAEHIHTA